MIPKTIISIILVLSIPATTLAGAKDIIKFGSGVITAYALHEVGHVAGGYLTGTDLDWKVGTYNQPIGFEEHAEDDAAGLIVNASGLITQLAVNTVILDSNIDRSDSYVHGIMWWNIVNPIIYALDYWFIGRTNRIEGDGYRGDLSGIEHYAGADRADFFAFFVAGIAILQGCEFYFGEGDENKSEFMPQIGLMPYQSGAVLQLTWNF